MLWMGRWRSGGSLHRAALFGVLHGRTRRLVALLFPPSLQPTFHHLLRGRYHLLPLRTGTVSRVEDGRPVSLPLTVVTAIVTVCADSMLRRTSKLAHFLQCSALSERTFSCPQTSFVRSRNPRLPTNELCARALSPLFSRSRPASYQRLSPPHPRSDSTSQAYYISWWIWSGR
jgi:hypothetical protein